LNHAWEAPPATLVIIDRREKKGVGGGEILRGELKRGGGFRSRSKALEGLALDLGRQG